VRAQDEEMARRLLQSGQKFYQDRQYKEALDDFNKVLQYPKSPLPTTPSTRSRGIQFEVLRDLKAADATADRLLKEYASADMAPRAQVLKGRISLATGLTPDLVSSAIANFDRGVAAVRRDRRGSRGDVLRGRGGTARRPSRGRPSRGLPIWPRNTRRRRPCARAALVGVVAGADRSAGPRTGAAPARPQSIPVIVVEAPVAHAWITILYRLYIRVPATQPAYAFSSSIGTAGGKIRDFRDFGIGSNDHLFVATKASLIELGGTGRGDQIDRRTRSARRLHRS
jgi:hypothetical protein